MKRLIPFCLLMALAAVALAACQPSQAKGGTGPTPAAEATAEVSVIAATAPAGTAHVIEGTAVSGEPALVYARSGGIAGIRETYTIYKDGRIVANKDGQASELHIPAEQVEALLSQLEALDVAGMASGKPSGPGSKGADRFQYSLTIMLENKPLTLTMAEGAPDQPAALVAAFGAVSELIASATE